MNPKLPSLVDDIESSPFITLPPQEFETMLTNPQQFTPELFLKYLEGFLAPLDLNLPADRVLEGRDLRAAIRFCIVWLNELKLASLPPDKMQFLENRQKCIDILSRILIHCEIESHNWGDTREWIQ